LQLFDHFEHIQGRSPEWFVAMAALGIDHGLWADFAQKNVPTGFIYLAVVLDL
jgi:hypothetical protein